MIVTFDLNGTLTDTQALVAPWGADAPARLAPEALDEAVAMAMVDTLTGTFRPFLELLRAALQRRAELAGLPTAAVAEATQIAKTLPARPDAGQALDLLRDRGHAIHVLTNSSAQAARVTLDAADLLDRVDRIDAADAVQAYKPDRRVYALAEPDAVFVAAHWWDVTGAARAGLRTIWLDVDDRVLPESAVRPELSASSLLEIARTLVGEVPESPRARTS